MKGLILAAGYGTRLYPLTLNLPKPLLEVGGKTIMERHLTKLEAVGTCDGVYIVTNSKFAHVISSWSEKHKFRFPVEIVDDGTITNEDRLGAIGDIRLVLDKKAPSSDVLIMAGDNLFEFPLSGFVSFAGKKGCLTVALYDVKERELAKKYGIVSLGVGEQVTDFQEKPKEPGSTLASTGIYYLPEAKLGFLGKYLSTGNSKDAPGNFVKWMSENDKVYGYVFREGWYDIGDIDSLHKADREYREKGI
ncbi:MAG: nucleotidyltransferase family protein [Candidatus Omnitrophica bacterium]|nr:nucleotidyltransferase family protein [Candidatus Omnitrophota bacterium]